MKRMALPVVHIVGQLFAFQKERVISMKFLTGVLIGIVIIVSGCSGNSQQLQSFDHSQLKSKLTNFSFQPKLPTLLPFQVQETLFTPPPEELKPYESYQFEFIGSAEKNRTLIRLATVQGKNVTSNLEGSYEPIEVGGVEGQILIREDSPMTLTWDEGNVHYRLEYVNDRVDTEVMKEELVHTAESFE